MHNDTQMVPQLYAASLSMNEYLCFTTFYKISAFCVAWLNNLTVILTQNNHRCNAHLHFGIFSTANSLLTERLLKDPRDARLASAL